jgi:hypothetical protein
MPSWFRVDAHITRNAKVALLSSDAVRWTYICVLAEGKIAQRQGRWKSLRHVSSCLPHRQAKHIKELIGAGLLDVVDDGQVVIHDWDDWQSTCPSDPTTAVRQRRYRNAHRNGTVTAARNGQTETETEIKAGPPTPHEAPSGSLPACPPSSPPARRASAARMVEISPEQEQAIDHALQVAYRKHPRDHVQIAQTVRDALYADAHPEAILQGLEHLAKYSARDPAAYLAKILRVESGNKHEADAIARGGEWKSAGGGLKDLIEHARKAANGNGGSDTAGTAGKEAR